MKDLLSLDPKKEAEKVIKFIKGIFKDQGFQKAIIAISGGIDSAVTLALAVKALGKENIFTLQLPYKHQSVYRSNLIIEKLEIPSNQRLVININQPVDKLKNKLSAKKHPLRFGNIMARVRMICLFDQAQKHHCLVIGTENKSENLLGYFTRFGDAASDLEPLSHLYKTQIYQLAKFLKIPPKIINHPPTAGLWPDQTDEKELGFSYAQADPILHLLKDKNFSLTKITQLGFDKKIFKKVTQRLDSFSFKQKVPYLI